MSVPSDRRYLPSHEWHQVTGDIVTIGITQAAADQLTDITYVSLPRPGTTVTAGKPFGEIESVKATSDLYSGVSGQVVEVNAELASNPGLVNQDPLGKGWMIRVRLSNLAEFERLLSAQDYERGQAG
jgi:glycine cleavage system H protein